MTSPTAQKLSLGALIALVVGSMVGAGIFTLPAAFASTTGALGAMIAWCVAGAGMLMLAFVFQTLAQRKPHLDSGIYAYAKDGFGNYLGFAAAFGYWAACCLADVACLVLIKSTLGAFFPVFGDGSTPAAIVAASAMVWAVHFLVLRGIRQAAALNTIATYAKIVPIALFIVVVIAAFKADVFALNFWGGQPHDFGSVFGQARSTMLLTVFVFVGIEGASVYSRYARNRTDVGLATVLGFLGVLCLLVLVTMLSYGILLRPDLAASAQSVDGGRAGSGRGTMGSGVRQRRTSHLGSGKLPLVVAAGRGSRLRGGEGRHDAVVPGQGKRQQRRSRRAVAHECRHSVLPDPDLIRREHLHACAQDDELDDADSVPARCGVWIEARVDARHLHRAATGSEQGSRAGFDRHESTRRG